MSSHGGQHACCSYQQRIGQFVYLCCLTGRAHLFSFCVLQGSLLPPSYYLMKNILNVQAISSVEWHSCPLGCTGWEPIPQSAWKQHSEDSCARCKGKRFKLQKGKLIPVRVNVGPVNQPYIGEIFYRHCVANQRIDCKLVSLCSIGRCLMQ